MPKLIRLTSNGETVAKCDNYFDSAIKVKKGAKMAVHSCSFEADKTAITINTTPSYDIEIFVTSSQSYTIKLDTGTYDENNYGALLADIYFKLNDSIPYDILTGQLYPAMIGLNWFCSIDKATKNVFIGMNKSQYLKLYYGDDTAYLEGVDYVDPEDGYMCETGITPSTNPYKAQAWCATEGRLSIGGGVYRAQLRRIRIGAQNENFGIGLAFSDLKYKIGDVLEYENDILAGIYVDANRNDGSGNYKISIITPDGTTTGRDDNNPRSIIHEINRIAVEGDVFEIAVVDGVLLFNHYDSTNSYAITELYTILYGDYYNYSFNADTTIPGELSKKTVMYPMLFFNGSSTGGTGNPSTLNNVRYTQYIPTYVEKKNLILQNTNLSYVPEPIYVASQRRIIFNNENLKQFLGYKNANSGVLLSSGDLKYEAEYIFKNDIYADGFIIVLRSINIESYDGYKGGRSPILDILPVNDDNIYGVVNYKPTYLNYIDLDNTFEYDLRNIRVEVLNNDYSEINIRGVLSIGLMLD